MANAFSEVVSSLFKHRRFAFAMAAREFRSANRGALLGYGWLVLRPFIQVAAYVAIITYVFEVRLGLGAGRFEYVLYVLSGLVAWQALQRALEDAPSLIRDRIEMLKQTVYPLETLPLSTLITSSLGPAIGMLVYLVVAIFTESLAWSVLLLPIPIVLFAILALGMSWIMMIAGVVLKDLREIVSVIMGLLVFFSPVIITEEMVGERLWNILLLNPIAHVVISFRDVFTGEFHFLSWVVFSSSAALAFLLGAIIITRMKLLINEYI